MDKKIQSLEDYERLLEQEEQGIEGKEEGDGEVSLYDKMTKEIHESGALVGELFKQGSFIALVFKKGVCLKNGSYFPSDSDYKPLIVGGKSYIKLNKEDFGVVLKAADDWEKVKDSLWGERREISNCMGYTVSFFPPNSKDSTLCCPNASGGNYSCKGPDGSWNKIFHKPGIDEFKRNVNSGGLDFTLERFCFVIRGAGQIVRFDEWQVPFIRQAFELHYRKEGILAPTQKDICRLVEEEYNGISISDLSNWKY